jgi:hypothetical protein
MTGCTEVQKASLENDRRYRSSEGVISYDGLHIIFKNLNITLISDFKGLLHKAVTFCSCNLNPSPGVGHIPNSHTHLMMHSYSLVSRLHRMSLVKYTHDIVTYARYVCGSVTNNYVGSDWISDLFTMEIIAAADYNYIDS